MRIARTLFIVLLCVIWIRAQGREQLLQAIAWEAKREFKTALDLYKGLIDDKDPEIKAQAQLRIGKIYLDQLGQVEEAKQYFEQAGRAGQFRELASEARFHLGRARLQAAYDVDGLKSALADFEGIVRGYKDTPAYVPSLMLSAEIQKNLQYWDEAISSYQSVFFESPSSQAAPRALLLLAGSLIQQGKFQQGAEQLQRLRLYYSGSEEAKSALDLLTNVYRLHLSGSIPPKFEQVGIFQETKQTKLENPIQAAILPDQTLLVLDRGGSNLLHFDQGKILEPPKAAGYTSLFLDYQGRIYEVREREIVRGEQSIVPQYKDKAEVKSFDRLYAFAMNSLGEMLVATNRGLHILDAKSRHVTANRRLYQAVPFGSETGDVMRLQVDSRNAFYLLSQDQKAIRIIDREGKLITQNSEKDRIEDFALDVFNNLYVLTNKSELTIYKDIHSQKSRFIPFGPPIPLNDVTGKKLEGCQALAVGRSGQIYVVAKKEIVVLR